MDETLHILIEHSLGIVVSLIGAILTPVVTFLIVRAKLKAGQKALETQLVVSKETVEASATDIIQRAAASLAEEQSDRIQTLHCRVDALEKERENLFIQIRALTQIIEAMKKERDEEREKFQKDIEELRKRIEELTIERDALRQQIESLQQHGRPETSQSNTESS